MTPSDIKEAVEFGKEMLAAFAEYFSALDELIGMGNTRMAKASSYRYQAAYQNIFAIAGRYFHRTAHGERLKK